MRNTNTSYADDCEITAATPCYDPVNGELHGWTTKTGSMRAYVGLPWLKRFLIETSKPKSYLNKFLSMIGLNGYTNNNVHIKPMANYLKKNPENLPEKITRLLAKHPEILLIPLVAIFPTMLNIPVFKMLMARKLGG